MPESLAALAPEFYPVALGLLSLLALVQTARLWWAHAGPALRLSARRRRGSAGEREAEGLLRGAGYTILSRQPTARVSYALGRRPLSIELRGDLLVRRGGKRLLAEVKTGSVAPRLTHAETRRQILEYAHAFEVDGLLLVDADRGAIDEVELPERLVATRQRLPWAALTRVLLLGALLGASATYYALKHW